MTAKPGSIEISGWKDPPNEYLTERFTSEESTPLKRLITFASIFLGTALLIFLLVFGLNREAMELVFDNREAISEGSEWVEKTYSMAGLADYISSHPDLVSVYSIEPGNPEATIAWAETTPRPMGMLSSYLLMTAFASEMESGAINPEEMISLDDVQRFQLPRIGDRELEQAIRLAKEQQQGSKDAPSISLDRALTLLARTKSPALYDYLLSRLGHAPLVRLYQQLGLQETDLPLPHSGILLTLAPSIQGVDAATILNYWQGTGRRAFETEATANSLAFAEGDRREDWIQTLEEHRLGLDFQQQKELLSLFPKTTAKEMVHLLDQMIRGELVSAGVSERVRGWLSYAVDESRLGQHFTHYGALYDSRLGLLNGMDFGINTDGNTRIQALFFDRIHLAVWFHLSSNLMHQEFLQRIMWDGTLRETLKQATTDTTS